VVDELEDARVAVRREPVADERLQLGGVVRWVGDDEGGDFLAEGRVGDADEGGFPDAGVCDVGSPRDLEWSRPTDAAHAGRHSGVSVFDNGPSDSRIASVAANGSDALCQREKNVPKTCPQDKPARRAFHGAHWIWLI
jgi:hypothetical protein